MDEWAAFFSGNYQGRIRAPGGEWEDLIGPVTIECSANQEGSLDVTITILEFGRWAGRLRLADSVLEGSTGQGDTYFRCAIQERGTEEIQACFYGGIYGPPAELLFELHLASDWRRHRPGQG
jgi:hypothetical protein